MWFKYYVTFVLIFPFQAIKETRSQSQKLNKGNVVFDTLYTPLKFDFFNRMFDFEDCSANDYKNCLQLFKITYVCGYNAGGEQKEFKTFCDMYYDKGCNDDSKGPWVTWEYGKCNRIMEGEITK